MPRLLHLPLLLASALPALGQMPPGWTMPGRLGEDMRPGAPWAGFGVWSADKRGPAAALVQSLGLGNALTGQGFLLEAGLDSGPWSVAGQFLLFRDPDGGQRITVHQGHLTYQTRGGWRWGLEKEPMVWGYGLNGGYLLGDAASPVPKLRMESPFRDLSLFRMPLGAWKADLFLGRLESHRLVGEESQDPSYRSRATALGQPEGPMLSGLRAEARFGANVEFYLNWLSLFGGTVNGVSRTAGYSAGDWLTAFTGSKDALAEANLDQTDASTYGQNFAYKNKARSAANADLGLRVRLPALERLLRADDVRAYLSRGSKAVNFNYGLVTRNPETYLFKDLTNDLADIRHLAPARTYNRVQRYLAPTLQVPNDTLGLLMAWPRHRLGLEYLDTVNQANQFGGRPVEGGHRSFEHGDYLSGFYYAGDPLGTALGGEARYGTARVEWDASPAVTLQTWIHQGQRPWRDAPEFWALDHPGKEAVTNRFTGLQQTVSWRGPEGWSLAAAAGFQHQSAVLNERGARGNALRYALQVGRRWSRQ